MAKTSTGPAAPRLAQDLPLLDGPSLCDETEWSGSQVRGDLSCQVADRVEINSSRLVETSLVGTELYGVRLVDVMMERCDLSGASLQEATLHRVQFTDCRLSAVTLSSSRLHHVRFVDCKMDDANLRMANGDHVAFQRCLLRGADLYASRISYCWLLDSDLSGVELSKADLPGVRLHGSTIDDLRGATSLRGAVIDSSQVLPLARSMLPALGVVVDDERNFD